MHLRIRSIVTAATVLGFTFGGTVQAQDANGDLQITTEAFLQPASNIADAVMAPRHLNVTLGNPSPDGMHFLNQQGDGAPTMAMFAKPFYRLGGLQIDYVANRSRSMTTRSGVRLLITHRETGDITVVEGPDGARVSGAAWSPDGSTIAFFAHSDDETHIYTADPMSGRTRQVTRRPVLATYYTSIEWTADSRSIVAVLIPEDRGPPPAQPAVPTAPQVRLTTPETNRLRTYPDLLQDQHEIAQVEYYTTGQLAVIDVGRRRARNVGEPALVRSVEVSPDGMHALVTTTRTPFSYIVPTNSAGTATEIWNLADGTVMALVSEQEIRAGAPVDSSKQDADPDRRNASWRPDGTLGFLQMVPRAEDDTAQADEEEDEEGPSRSRRKDRVMQWTAPFDDAAMTVVYENNRRISSVRFSANAQTLFVREQTRQQRVHDFAVVLSDPDTKHTIYRGKLIRRRRGQPTIATTTVNGTSVVRMSSDGGHVFVRGIEYHEDPMQDAPQSYIDRVAIEGGEKERIYESDNNGMSERLLAILDNDATQLLVNLESSADVPDSYVRNTQDGTERQLTQNIDYTPDITGAERRRYEVTRVDGFKFAVDVTLPQNWNGDPLPGMMWFYPREYTDQDGYDETRRTYNKNAFPNLGSRSMDILVRAGYVVIEPDAPIIGEEGRMNDNYEHDLRNNLAAVIDLLDKEGIIDRERLGIGGHSYGAFGTVNAMVHTPFFKAGIAGDGNYNRTLTPFAFQSERRSVWEAPNVYLSMSPLFHANNLTGALLMYHGEHDQNVGTFPINSWRLFEALESLGKTASLYVYPLEHHGPATRETLLDLWARWTAWLDKYVKNAKEAEKIAADDKDSQ